ncbi:hypothetical protein OIDMADRAFT_19084 [Oidiodendron maius Zn]|uniref:LEA domain-containing protein n=1 Tax=Oidiodendron maius (strain Zn) TaxID=913774 RepID=A0A0C3HCU9_OIDMZ|nr:hypothetical protein OIDMADRAFT_19084 [Oidiodendron maius Zn]
MSFLTRTAIRSTRSMVFAPRLFSTSLATRKTATEAVKDTVKTVDRKVSDKLVDGIELGQTATRKAKAAVGIESEDAKTKTAQFTAKAKDTAREAAGEARGKADDAAAEAKKRLGETKGKL